MTCIKISKYTLFFLFSFLLFRRGALAHSGWNKIISTALKVLTVSCGSVYLELWFRIRCSFLPIFGKVGEHARQEDNNETKERRINWRNIKGILFLKLKAEFIRWSFTTKKTAVSIVFFIHLTLFNSHSIWIYSSLCIFSFCLHWGWEKHNFSPLYVLMYIWLNWQ